MNKAQKLAKKAKSNKALGVEQSVNHIYEQLIKHAEKVATGGGVYTYYNTNMYITFEDVTDHLYSFFNEFEEAQVTLKEKLNLDGFKVNMIQNKDTFGIMSAGFKIEIEWNI